MNALLNLKMSPRRSKWRKRSIIAALLVGSLFVVCCSVARKPDWTVADMPPQKGKIYVVTGGTSGIGYESAKALAASGAQVVIASRNPEKGKAAIDGIREETPGARVRFEELDLGDLASVRALANRLNNTLPHLDGLINNAGVMHLPKRQISKDGFEMHLAVNYLGHFALTEELLPLLQKADAPRVVTLSSIAASRGKIDFNDLQAEKSYEPMPVYAQSKLACLMFAQELQRRSDAGGWGIQSMASHPGLSRTPLNEDRRISVLFQPASRGALPTLYAVTSPEARGGNYYGPTGPMEVRGPVGTAKVPAAAQDLGASARLWSVSEQLTGTRYLSEKTSNSKQPQ